MEFGIRHDTTDFCPRHLIVTDLLRGNWCNGFWPLATVAMSVCLSVCHALVLYEN